MLARGVAEQVAEIRTVAGRQRQIRWYFWGVGLITILKRVFIKQQAKPRSKRSVSGSQELDQAFLTAIATNARKAGSQSGADKLLGEK